MSWFLPVAADDGTWKRVEQDWLCKCSKMQKCFPLNIFAEKVSKQSVRPRN